MKSIKNLFSQFSFLDAVKLTFLELVRKFLMHDAYYAYSQTGEDIILENLLKDIKAGFYVEVGCNEPIQHSNTFKLYKSGWHGITIDANEKMIGLHKSIRKSDIQVFAAVSNEVKEVTFYEFEMDEISTIDNDFYSKVTSDVQIVSQTSLTTCTLDSILDSHVPKGKEIDLLSIDVEGHDYQVIKSIDLYKYRPKVIIIEMHNFDLLNPLKNNIYGLISAHEYVFVGYVVWNGYFMSKEYYETTYRVNYE